MPNFREYLKENTQSKIVLLINLSAEVNVREDFKTYIQKAAIKALTGYGKIDVSIDREAIEIQCIGLSQTQCKWEEIEDHYTKVKDAVNGWLEDFGDSQLEHGFITLQCMGLPSFPISMNEGGIDIYFQEGERISGIDKIIGDCDYVSLFDPENIEGGVLSLLRIKSQVNFEGSSNRIPEWQPILQKHLNGDKDILDCQEELISAGLKEFAKL